MKGSQTSTKTEMVRGLQMRKEYKSSAICCNIVPLALQTKKHSCKPFIRVELDISREWEAVANLLLLCDFRFPGVSIKINS